MQRDDGDLLSCKHNPQDSIISEQKMDNVIKIYENFIASNDVSESEDDSDIDDLTFDDNDILEKLAQTRANRSLRRSSVGDFAIILDKFKSSNANSTPNFINQWIKQQKSSQFNEIPANVLNSLETMGDEKASALILAEIDETTKIENEHPQLIANELKTKLNEQFDLISKRMDESHQRYLNLLETVQNLTSSKDKLDDEKYYKEVLQKFEEITSEEKKIDELDVKLDVCEDIINNTSMDYYDLL